MRATDGFFDGDIINGIDVGRLEHEQSITEQVSVDDVVMKQV